MAPRKRLTREEILRQLRKFAKEVGRPPKSSEQDFQDVVYAAKREFGSWGHALKIAGLQTYKAWRRKRTFVAKIRRLLNYNPMNLKELREELGKSSKLVCSDLSLRISVAIKQVSDIKSIGPRRNKIYFLEGQESLAQSRLDKILSELSELHEEIFYHLRHPMTKSQIKKLVSEDKLTGYKKTKIHRCLNELMLSGLIYKAKFVVGAKGSKRFKAIDLFADLACKTYFCRFDCSDEVAKLVLANIPLKSEDPGFRKALTHHLKRILPKNVFLLVERKCID